MKKATEVGGRRVLQKGGVRRFEKDADNSRSGGGWGVGGGCCSMLRASSWMNSK
jgi:hypothetical protein